jgi:D-arabinose 1-dehydrogenase-like Zn-dependent alcohol dehydrogenase
VGGRAVMQEMLDFAAAQGIKPMVESMPLSQVRAGAGVSGSAAVPFHRVAS